MVMVSLIQLVRGYCTAHDLETRLARADAIARTVGPKLKTHLHILCGGQPEVAGEAFAETLVYIAKNLHQFRGEHDGAFWSWCYHVARTSLLQRLRKLKADRLHLMPPEEIQRYVEASTQVEALPAGTRLDLEYAMDLLQKAQPPCCDYLWKRYIMEWDYGDIAREYGLSDDAVKMRVWRCLETAVKLMAANP